MLVVVATVLGAHVRVDVHVDVCVWMLFVGERSATKEIGIFSKRNGNPNR